MSKQIILKLILLTLSFGTLFIEKVEANPSSRNPFIRVDNISCEKEEKAIYALIGAWQLKGIIKSSDHKQHIWLAANQRRLMVSVTVLEEGKLSHDSLAITPWQLVAIDKTKIVWQAQLSPKCHKTVFKSMLLIPIEEESLT